MSEPPTAITSTAHAAVPDQLEGWVPDLALPGMLDAVMECAFSYRGDVTIKTKAGESHEGYLFDRVQAANAADSKCRMIISKDGARRVIAYSEIQSVVFSGKDTATGKSFQTWVEKYLQKKAAGEKNIGIEPEALD